MLNFARGKKNPKIEKCFRSDFVVTKHNVFFVITTDPVCDNGMRRVLHTH